jgi:uncharacterized protein YodC (DUF2158 family)
MSDAFALGDTVRLKSGGPVMTINEKGPAGVLVCIWFCGADVKHHAFRPEALAAAGPEPGAPAAPVAEGE